MKTSAINALPEDVKQELNNKLILSHFSGYEDLASWLFSKGFSISKSSVHRYGKKFKESLEKLQLATEQARAVSEAAGDDENSLGDALTRLAQQRAFEMLLNLQEIDPDRPVPIEVLPKLGRMVADLNRSGVAVKKYRTEVLERATKVAKEVEVAIKNKGLSEETASIIRAQVMGIVDG